LGPLFTKYFELEKMFKKNCYPSKSEKEGETSMTLNLSNQEFLPSHPQHTKVVEGISENVNDQQVKSNLISIINVQLKDESYGGVHCSTIKHGFVPSIGDNCNQSLRNSKSFRDSRSKEGDKPKEGLLGKKVLTPKTNYFEEKNTGNKKRLKVLVKDPIKESWIVSETIERKTMQVFQEKLSESSGMSLGPGMKGNTIDLQAHNERRNRKSCMIANVSHGPEAQGVTIKSEAHISSVRVINGKSIDFRCTICKELPRKLNRSELYRHYATRHFYKELRKEFGHLKVCPYCHIELKGSIASHFGQKHLFVESYLPTKSWISRGWNRTSGQKIRKKIKVSESLRYEKSVLPEVPTRFDIDGPGNTVSTVVAIVDGFEIEFEKEIVADQAQVEKRFAINENEVVECRICKHVFEEEQATVMHIHERHGISVSGDVTRDIIAFLTAGYITIKGRSSVSYYSGAATTHSINDAHSSGVIFDYESRLNDEELQLLK